MLKRCVLGLFLVTLLQPWLLFGLNQNTLLNNIELKLMNIIAYSQMLEEELGNSLRISIEQKQHIEKMLNELNALRNELGEQKIRLVVSGSLLAKFKNRVVALLNII